MIIYAVRHLLYFFQAFHVDLFRLLSWVSAMELDLEIARLVLGSRGVAQCGEQMLHRARGIIRSGVPLSIHTFIVHRQCQQKFLQCTSAVLIEVWTITVKPEGDTQEKVLF